MMASRMRVDPVVDRAGDIAPEPASDRRGTRWWNGMPLLIWSICRRYQLDAADAENAAQSIWLQAGATSWATSATRPRFPAGWPPPTPAGMRPHPACDTATVRCRVCAKP